MRSERLALAGLSAAFLLGWGCGPPEIMPVAPPGMEYRPVVQDEEPAEALGETRGSAAVNPNLGVTVNPLKPAEPTQVGQSTTTPEGLVYETLRAGTGPEKAESGKRVTVHYTGTFTDGRTFDSSRDSGRPFQFVLGTGGVIRGWELGVPGMVVGERRKLTVPPDLGYGDRPPSTKIPPNSTLIFDIELLKVE